MPKAKPKKRRGLCCTPMAIPPNAFCGPPLKQMKLTFSPAVHDVHPTTSGLYLA